MTFKEAVTHVFQNYATFSGRARRSEYWYFTLFNVAVITAISILSRVGGYRLENAFRYLSGLFSLGMFVPSLAVCWRRLHDIGKSGAYYFLFLIPLVGAIILLVWYCRDSDPNENQYGPCPKYVSSGYTRSSGSYGSDPYSSYSSGGYAQTDPGEIGYVFLYCPNCGGKLRVPNGKGSIQVRCPKCSSIFNARS